MSGFQGAGVTRRAQITAITAGLLTLALLVGGVGYLPEGAERAGGSQPVEAHATPFGVSVEMDVEFTEGMTLARPRAVWGDLGTAKAHFWPLDGADHEGEDLDPLPLESDTKVLISSLILPSCADRTSDEGFELQVMTSGDGERSRRVLRPSNPEVLTAALDDWCDMGPSVDATGSMSAPDGRAEAYLVVTNPGPDAIRVEIPAYREGDAAWEPLTRVVKPGERAEITVKGTGISCDAPIDGSWQKGRMLIDGEQFTVDSEDSWCG